MDRFQAMVTFVRVVETGSFSAAARQLGIGQPAVSKAISQLERRLGVSLLIRTTQRFTPTEAGQRFYEGARAAVEEAEEAEAAARGAGNGFSGRLRVSAATTFARLHIIPLLSRVLTENPSLEIDVILDDRVIDPIAEGIDLSLRLGNLPDSSATARKLATSARLVVATPKYLERAGEPRNPADLAEHEAIVHTGMPSAWTFVRNGIEVSTTLRGRLRVSAAEGLRAAVLADLGLAVASEWTFRQELADGTVRRVLDGWSLPPTDLWAVFSAGKLATAKARQFASFVEEEMSRDVPDHSQRE